MDDSNFGSFVINPFCEMSKKEQNDLQEIINTIFITGKLQGLEMIIAVTFSQYEIGFVNSKGSMYILGFYPKIVKKHKFDKVVLYKNYGFNNKVICSSSMYRYKNGKLSKPIIEFISRME